MAQGFWFGDQHGGSTYEGAITKVTLDGAQNLKFDYTFGPRSGGSGNFSGRIEGDTLTGTWTERYDGQDRVGEVDMQEATVTSAALTRRRFTGRYWLTKPQPSHPDDVGKWTIEFDV